MKIRPVGDKLFHADRKTDRQTDRERNRQTDRYYEANSLFLQFCERAYKVYIYMMAKETPVGSQDFMGYRAGVDEIYMMWETGRGYLRFHI
jgi:hypothetical protein